ncbi:MAG: thioredoxin family protein [Dehalococcoidia bacterium]|nr:thioredoxin family protein [Dehalococcoidia bacterium]
MSKKILLLLLLIILSCSSSPESSNYNSLFIITEDISIGENRVSFALLDQEGESIVENVDFFYKKIDEENPKIIESTNITKWPNNKSVFTSYLYFQSEGYWEIYAEYEENITKATIEVKEYSNTLSVGSYIDPINTPSINDNKIEDISTDIKPDLDLYTYTLSQALKEKKPILLSFSTPGLCVTATCGPQLEELKLVKNNNKDNLIVIHVEVWKNFKEIMSKGDLSIGKVNKSVEKFGINTEPWTFLINKDGLVLNRYQGYVSSNEMEKDLNSINVHDQ